MRSLETNSPRCRTIDNMLANRRETIGPTPDREPVTHSNVRGSNYYRDRGGH